MSLQKTCMGPDSAINEILGKPILKLVVVGNNQDIVNIADNLALYPPMNTDRYVIWYPSISVSHLSAKFPGLAAPGKVKAFSLTKSNMIADIITKDEAADYVRIDSCFTRAGA